MNLFLVYHNYRPGYLKNPRKEPNMKLIKKYNLNIIKDYIFTDRTFELFHDLIEKYESNTHTDDDLGILLGYPSKYPSMLKTRYGYGFWIFQTKSLKEMQNDEKMIQIFAFFSNSHLNKLIFSNLHEGIKLYNETYGTNYILKIIKNIRRPVKYYLEKLKEGLINKSDIFEISNKFFNCRAPGFAKLIRNVDIDVFKNSKIINFMIEFYSETERDTNDPILSFSEVDNDLCISFLEIIDT